MRYVNDDEESYWSRMFRKRLTRRQALRMAALGGAGALSAAYLACRGEGPTATVAPGESPAAGVSSVLADYRSRFHYSKLKDLPGQKEGPKYGGTFRFSHYQGFTGAWDITGPEADALASFAPNHFNGLVTFRQDDFSNVHNLYEVVSDLAQRWETPDQLTVTFRLPQGARFHNVPPVSGREVTSEDVKFSLEVYKQSVAQGPILADVDRIETPDRYTVTVRFARPAAYFLQSLTYPVFLVFAREAYERKEEVFVRQPIGTGPFVLERWDPPNIYSMRKNPQYFRKDPRTGMQLPYVDAIEAPILNLNVTLEEAAFRDGRIHTIWTHTRRAFDQMLATFPDNVGQVTTPPPGFQPYITVKLDKPPLNDQRVRAALQHLIDIDAIVEGILEGMAGPGLAHDFSFFGKEWPWTLEELQAMGANMGYDPQKARQLLSAAGVGRLRIKFMYGIGEPIHAEVYRTVANFWRQGGIEVVQDEVPITEIARFNAAFFGKQWGDVDVMGFSFAGPGMDEDQYCYGPLNSRSPRNFYWVNDPTLDELTERQRRQFDINERRRTVEEIIKRELSQSYRIWLVNIYKMAVRRGFVFNVVDTIHAWHNIGWGSKGNEMVWFSRAP
ncbi:Glutathione-binding protein GsiB [bacterium HR24]|nr:Glutathione-binding protein GsiB [bacterium HR24]